MPARETALGSPAECAAEALAELQPGAVATECGMKPAESFEWRGVLDLIAKSDSGVDSRAAVALKAVMTSGQKPGAWASEQHLSQRKLGHVLGRWSVVGSLVPSGKCRMLQSVAVSAVRLPRSQQGEMLVSVAGAGLDRSSEGVT